MGKFSVQANHVNDRIEKNVLILFNSLQLNFETYHELIEQLKTINTGLSEASDKTISYLLHASTTPSNHGRISLMQCLKIHVIDQCNGS